MSDPQNMEINAGNKGQLNQLLNRISETAAFLQKKVRFYLLLGILTACWPAYYFTSIFSLSLTTTGILLVLLSLPTSILYLEYSALGDMTDLPEKYRRMKDGLSQIQSNIQQTLFERAKSLKNGQSKSRIRDFISFGRLLFEIKEKLLTETGAIELFGNASRIANPVFGIIVLISILVILSLALLSVLTAILFLIF